MKQKIICEYKGGSHSYGLDTPTSDVDLRGVYIVNDLQRIIDPNNYLTSKCQVSNTDPEKDLEDKVYFEVRHFLHLLKKGSTQSIEMMFNEKWTQMTPLFKTIISQRKNLLDPYNLYNSIRGYSFSEYKLAVGARTGKLGGKRQTQVEKYGFSPKNWCNLLRILYCGETFFETGKYPVDLTGLYIHPQLMEIKCNPERFTLHRLNEMYNAQQLSFENGWLKNKEDICKQYSYDTNAATDLMLNCYLDKLYKADNRSLITRIYSLIKPIKD